MSHYLVWVIGDDPETQLAPYDENLESEKESKGIVPEEEKDRFIAYYNEKHPEDATLTFDDLYAKWGKDWNGSCWEKVGGEWQEFSTYNDNAKWDWYSLGGRWSGVFPLKEGSVGVVGEPGVFNNEVPVGWVDRAFLKDIDFEAMKAQRLKGRSEAYDEFMSKYDPNLEKQMIHPYFDYGIENIGTKENFMPESKESYLKKHGSIAPHALVKDGEWYERGTMGWWAIVIDEKDADDWNLQFDLMMKGLPPDTLISEYDCHI